MFDRFCARAQATLGLRAIAAAAVLAAALLANPASAAPDAAIVVDANTGKVLYSSNANARRYPASLTKMMTLYLLFEAIETGQTSLNDRITMSAHAAAQAPSKLGMKPGQTISVRDAILALVTKSANDVAVAIGEHIAGTETKFAQLMTARAHDLGMSRTVFKNASGLPNTAQVTTAHDLAILGRALREHYPQYYSYFSTPSFVWNGRRIANHNRLLGRVAGVDGIKTGYTRASGFNLVTSVNRGGRLVVAVVIGGETSKSRDNEMAGLLDKYVSRASTGKRTVASIPGKATAPVKVAAAAMPLPTLRPTQDGLDEADDANAAAAALVAKPVAASAEAPLTIAALVQGGNSVLAYSDADTTDDAEGDITTADEPADPPARTLSGWRIQIAASPTQSQAEDILDSALAKGSTVLASASPYTEPVEVDGSTLYRARFAGFRDKDAAWAACEYLKKQKFSCLAVSN